MRKNAARIFDHAQKGLWCLGSHEQLEADQKQPILDAYNLLGEYRLTLVQGGVLEEEEAIKVALEYTYLNENYCVDEIIRDLSDIRVTLKRAADARFRKHRVKVAEAREFLRSLIRGLRDSE